MWGEAAFGATAYGEPEDGTVSPFQNRAVFAVITFEADAFGVALQPGVGAMEFGFVASAVGVADRTKVRVIQTAPHSGRSRTGLSHTGLN
jgi:hypothetical protein